MNLITPIFESSELFKKPLGEQSDVVLKEMYTFKDRNEDEITLRPEYTTPMIRAAISNGLLNNLPAKFLELGKCLEGKDHKKEGIDNSIKLILKILVSDDFFLILKL